MLGGGNSSNITTNSTNNSTNTNSNNNSIIHYLCSDSLQSFKEWTENIRPLCNASQYNPFVSSNSFSSSISSLSLSSLSSSSPPNTSLFLNDNHQFKKNSPTPSSTTTTTNHNFNRIDQNYRVLRTLNIDIHEARNVCLSALLQSTSSNNNNITNGQIFNNNTNSSINYNLLPKYHKDNLYYCLLMFNNDAIVASTRITNSNNTQSNLTCNNSNNSNGFSPDSNISNGSNNNHFNNKIKSKDSIWDDSFSFDNLPLDVKELKICLYVLAKPSNFSASFVNNLKKIGNSSQSITSKMMDPIMIGSITIRLDDIMNKGLVESWYNLEPAVHVSPEENFLNNTDDLVKNNCTIRVKIRFCEEKIYLSRTNYQELLDYLMNESEHKHLCTFYEHIVPSTERQHLVQSLLRFYICQNKIVEMLKSFLIAEIERCADLSTLFRPASMSTSLMDHYMRTRCDCFLRKALEEPLNRILTLTSLNNNQSNATTIKSFELDPSKCPDQQQREQNLNNFQQALTDLISSICGQQAVNLFPNELKYLFYVVRQQVQQKWIKQKEFEKAIELNTNNSDDKLVKIYCVSAFVFLRLLCPALLNPKNFGLKFFNKNNQPAQPLPPIVKLTKELTFDYLELGSQFSVFTPSFMFTLSPPSLLSNLNSQSLTSLADSTISSSHNQLNCFNVSSFMSSSYSSSSNSTSSSSPIFLSQQNGVGINNYNNIGSPPPSTLPSYCSTNPPPNSSTIQNTSIYERHIKLLAKVLQTLANMTECKEPFMLPLSEFLNSKKSNITKFIEEISSKSEFQATSCDNKEDINIQFEYSTCKYLAILHRLLSSFIPQMKTYIAKYKQIKNDTHDDFQNQQLNNSNNNTNSFNDCSIINDENDLLFINSLQKLINILNDISNRIK